MPLLRNPLPCTVAGSAAPVPGWWPGRAPTRAKISGRGGRGGTTGPGSPPGAGAGRPGGERAKDRVRPRFGEGVDRVKGWSGRAAGVHERPPVEGGAAGREGDGGVELQPLNFPAPPERVARGVIRRQVGAG